MTAGTLAGVAVPTPEEKATLNVWPETGQILGLSKSSTYDGVARGEIPTIRVGRRLLVPTAALRRMLQLDGDTVERRAS
jgi:excisionase family DNA binding protein